MSAKKGQAPADGALVTPGELAAKYRVTTQTILQWYHDGVIPARVAVGRVYRFDEAEVEDGLRRHEAEKRGRQVPGMVATC